MSPDAQNLERFFTPAAPGQPPLDERYQEELQDFTSFFQKLATLDTQDWFANDETDRPTPAPAAHVGNTAPAAANPAPSQAVPMPVGPHAAGEMTEFAAAPLLNEASAQAPVNPVTQGRAAATAPGNPPTRRIAMYDSQAMGEAEAGQPGMVGFDARSIVSESRNGASWRGFLARLQLVLLVAFAATLLFAMGLGMGALVLSLPREAAFDVAPQDNAPAAKSAPQVAGQGQAEPSAGGASETKAAVPIAVPHSVLGKSKETVAEVTLPSFDNGKSAKAPNLTVQTKPTPVMQSAPAKADAVTGTLKPATNSAATDSKPAAESASAEVPAEANTVAAPLTATPAATVAEPAFALQVGACGSYACVEQFRNLLLSEVDSTRIRVVSAGSGAQMVQRIRVEPLSKDEALKLKETLAAKDARFAQAYPVALR